MKTVALGQSGVAVSQLGLGGFELGPEEGEQPDLPRAERVIAAAQDAGINWIDTAERYHETQNETLIGARARRLGDARRVEGRAESRTAAASVPTRSGLRASGASRASAASTSTSISFTAPDDTGVPLDETWGAMAELADEGLVRAIGLSNYSVEDVERCHNARRRRRDPGRTVARRLSPPSSALRPRGRTRHRRRRLRAAGLRSADRPLDRGGARGVGRATRTGRSTSACSPERTATGLRR